MSGKEDAWVAGRNLLLFLLLFLAGVEKRPALAFRCLRASKGRRRIGRAIPGYPGQAAAGTGTGGKAGEAL